MRLIHECSGRSCDTHFCIYQMVSSKACILFDVLPAFFLWSHVGSFKLIEHGAQAAMVASFRPPCNAPLARRRIPWHIKASEKCLQGCGGDHKTLAHFHVRCLRKASEFALWLLS
jgi:hypothetical protein